MNNHGESAGDEYAPASTIWGLAIGLMILAILLTVALICLLQYGSSAENLTTAVFLLIVAIGGAIGGLIHDLNSFVVYVGVGKLKHRWVPQYLVRPFLGMTLAMAVTLVVKGEIDGNFLNHPTAPPPTSDQPSSAKQGNVSPPPSKGQAPADAHPGQLKPADLKEPPQADAHAGKSSSAAEKKEPASDKNANTASGTVSSAPASPFKLSDAYYYAAIAVLVGMFVDLALQKLQDVMFAVFGRPEPKKDHFEPQNNNQKTESASTRDPQKVIAACESVWETNKSDDAKFVKAVAEKLAIQEIPEGSNADAILQLLQASPSWSNLGPDTGQQAKVAADQGTLVVGGLSSGELDSTNGQVVVVVAGPLDPGLSRYPTAYWGKLNGVGEKKRTIDAAFPEPHRKKVRYFVHQ